MRPSRRCERWRNAPRRPPRTNSLTICWDTWYTSYLRDHPAWLGDAGRGAWRPPVRKAVALRLGVRGKPPAPLKEAAKGLDVPPRRVGELARAVARSPHPWLWAPNLDAAIALAAQTTDPGEYQALLRAARLTRRPWHPAAVNALARLYGRAECVVWRVDLDLVRQIPEQLIHNRASDVASVSDVAALATKRLGDQISPDQVIAAMADSELMLIDGWMWRPGGKGGRPPLLITVARGMLAIAGTLPTTVIRDGWYRRLLKAHCHHRPPVQALETILRAHDAFIVETPTDASGDTTVRLNTPLTVAHVYDRPTMAIIWALRERPGQVATVEELTPAARAGGLQQDVATFLFFHEAFVTWDKQRWALVGSRWAASPPSP